MDQAFLTGFSPAAIILAFFGGIALLVWVGYTCEQKKQELHHAERLKALEMGHPLPDAEVARVGAESNRVITIGAVCATVPPLVMGTAVLGTMLVLYKAE